MKLSIHAVKYRVPESNISEPINETAFEKHTHTYSHAHAYIHLHLRTQGIQKGHHPAPFYELATAAAARAGRLRFPGLSFSVAFSLSSEAPWA